MYCERVEALHFILACLLQRMHCGEVYGTIGAKEETCDVQRVPKQFTFILFKDQPQVFLTKQFFIKMDTIHLPDADGRCRLQGAIGQGCALWVRVQ